MFWNEFEFEGTRTVVMDETGENEDVELMIDDDAVYIRQYNQVGKVDIPDLIVMTPKMFKDLIEALNYPQGMYKTVYKRGEV
jgi:hypothetical protein